MVFNKGHLILIHLLLVSILIFSSCEKRDNRQAEKSIEGIWNVTELRVSEGERSEFGLSINSEQVLTENLEVFHFSDENVTWTYEPGDTIIINEENWTLSSRKENAGFTRVRVFTLDIADYDFKCVFDDDTKNAEKKAEKMSLQYETDKIGPYSSIEIKLAKE